MRNHIQLDAAFFPPSLGAFPFHFPMNPFRNSLHSVESSENSDMDECDDDDDSETDEEEEHQNQNENEPPRVCRSCGRPGHLTARSRECPYHRAGVREEMVERAQLADDERLARRSVKSALRKYCKYDCLAEQIEHVAIGFNGVRVAFLMIMKVLMRTDIAATVPFMARANELYKLMHILNTNARKREISLNRLPIGLRRVAIALVGVCPTLHYDLSAHSQAVLEVSKQLHVNFKNHLQVQIPKRLINFVQGELDRPAADDIQNVRLMETATGGTFAKKQASEIISALQENRQVIIVYSLISKTYSIH